MRPGAAILARLCPFRFFAATGGKTMGVGGSICGGRCGDTCRLRPWICSRFSAPSLLDSRPETYMEAIVMQRPRRRGFIGAIAGAALLASLVPAVASAVGPATHLAFGTQPSSAGTNAPISPVVTVLVEDASNLVVTTDNSTVVTLAIGTNPGGGALSGTTMITAVNGVATFSSLSINNAGVGYTLSATSSPAWTPATSSAFSITLAQTLTFALQPGG